MARRREGRLPDLALSDLARAGLTVVEQPGGVIAYLVKHQCDAPGLLLETLQAPATDVHEEYAETITASLNGLSYIALTAVTPTPQSGERASDTSSDESRSWIRRTAPNPTFIYERAQVFEGLAILGDGRRRDFPTFPDTRAVLDLLEYVSEAAVDLEAPIMSMTFPAQIPARAVGENGDAWSPSVGPALRFSIALRPSPIAERGLASAKTRIGLVEKLCEPPDPSMKGQYNLAVRDPRPGARAGNWIPVSRSDRSSATSDDPLSMIVPVTFVGPARVGSTHAIVNYLKYWGDAVGVSACSIVSLNDMAFIHLQLCTKVVPDKTEEGDADEWSSWKEKVENSMGDGNPDTLVDGLSKAVDALTRKDTGQATDRSEIEKATNGYTGFLGPAYLVGSPKPDIHRRTRMKHRLISPNEIRGADGDGDDRGLWISWLTRRISGALVGPLKALEAAFWQVVPEGRATALRKVLSKGRATFNSAPYSIEYLVCREVSDGRLRAVGKLKLPRTVEKEIRAGFASTADAEFASDLCRHLESDWRRQLGDEYPVIELTVSWREFWLGHWSAPV